MKLGCLTSFLRFRRHLIDKSFIKTDVTLNLLKKRSFGKLCRSYSSVTDNASMKLTVSEQAFNLDSNDPKDTEKPLTQIENDSLINSSVIRDVSHYVPSLTPSFNLAAYANKSPLLQEFVKLGVELYKFDKDKTTAEYILALDFEKDVKKYLMFLHDNGVTADSFGKFITKYPFVFKEDLNNLQVRINYLRSKKFTTDSIIRIITTNPAWLSFSTREIDDRLGYFQKTFNLTGNEVRNVSSKLPRLITYRLESVKMNLFSFKEEMGFSDKEIKVILLDKPILFIKNRLNIVTQFNYVHNKMKISHELIVKQPTVLLSRVTRTEHRHRFLASLNRAQYDPECPGYVSLQALVSGTDTEFCRDVAKASIETYNLFMKTL